MVKRICQHCEKEFEFKNGRVFGAHVANCAENPNRQNTIEKIKKTRTLQRVIIKKQCLKCNKDFEVIRNVSKNRNEIIPKKEKQYCSRICANSIGGNSDRSKELKIIKCNLCGTEIKVKKQGRKKAICVQCKQKYYTKSNKFHFKLNDDCVICHKKIKKNKSNMCRQCYNTSGLHSTTMKGKTGGYREKGGRGKCGWYKGVWCDSSWELAWVLYSFDHNIKFIRNKQGFEYEYDNRSWKYYPDFQLEDGSFVEIKGFMSDQFIEKQKQFKHRLLVIDKKAIIPYLEYAIDKYGKDFIKLYDRVV